MGRPLLLLACLLFPLALALQSPTLYQPFGKEGLVSGAAFLQEEDEGSRPSLLLGSSCR